MKIIYENLGLYHVEHAVLSKKTMAVGVWQRRPLNSFIWAPATQELCDEANDLNVLHRQLRDRQIAFNQKLRAVRKAEAT